MSSLSPAPELETLFLPDEGAALLALDDCDILFKVVNRKSPEGHSRRHSGLCCLLLPSRPIYADVSGFNQCEGNWPKTLRSSCLIGSLHSLTRAENEKDIFLVELRWKWSLDQPVRETRMPAEVVRVQVVTPGVSK